MAQANGLTLNEEDLSVLNNISSTKMLLSDDELLGIAGGGCNVNGIWFPHLISEEIGVNYYKEGETKASLCMATIIDFGSLNGGLAYQVYCDELGCCGVCDKGGYWKIEPADGSPVWFNLW